MKRWKTVLPLVAVIILMSGISATANWIADPGFDDAGAWINGTIYQGAGLWHNDGLLPSVDPLNADNNTALSLLKTETQYMYQVILFDQPGALLTPTVSLEFYANARTESGSLNIFGLGVTLLGTIPQEGDDLADLYHQDIGFAEFPHPGGWYSYSHTFSDKDRDEFVGLIVRSAARNGHMDNASVTFELIPVPLPSSWILFGPPAMAFLLFRPRFFPKAKAVENQ